MGILRAHIHALCMEQRHKRIRGATLTLGQLALYATLDETQRIMRRHGLDASPLPPGFDTRTKIPGWKGTSREHYANTQALLHLMGADQVLTADVSAYESPDFIIDLNQPAGDDLCERFDTIVDSGTLEHVFDVPTALSSVARMLRVGGNIIHLLPASNFIDHGFYSFSPTLFFDFYQANGFDSIQCYLREISPYFYEKKGRLFRYEGVGEEVPLTSASGLEVLFFATKRRATPSPTVKPMQTLYARLSSWSTATSTAQSAQRQPVVPAGSLTGLLKACKRRCTEAFMRLTLNIRPVWLNCLLAGHRHAANIKLLGRF